MKEELYGPNVWLIEEMYRQYQEEPDSVAESWQDFLTVKKCQISDNEHL